MLAYHLEICRALSVAGRNPLVAVTVAPRGTCPDIVGGRRNLSDVEGSILKVQRSRFAQGQGCGPPDSGRLHTATACRHPPQVEPPGIVPISGFGQFDWGGTDCNLVHPENLVLRPEGRAGKNRGPEFNLAQAVFHLQDSADTEGPVDRAQAPNLRAGFNRRIGRDGHRGRRL